MVNNMIIDIRDRIGKTSIKHDPVHRTSPQRPRDVMIVKSPLIFKSSSTSRTRRIMKLKFNSIQPQIRLGRFITINYDATIRSMMPIPENPP